jgi:hypothetical protein
MSANPHTPLLVLLLQALVFCLVYNFAGACVIMATKAEDRMSSFFLSAIYLIAGTPAALVGWYLKVYNAAAR